MADPGKQDAATPPPTPAPHTLHHRRGKSYRNLLAAVVESSTDAIVTKDLQGIVTTWNRGAERIFGYTAKEMVGQPITRLFPPDRLAEEASILARVRAGGRVEPFETKRIRKDGATIDVSVTISPLRDSRGTVVGASKIARDITDSKQAQRERALLAAIVASSSDAICTKSLDGIVMTWNRGAERMFGHRAQDIVGHPMEGLFPPERLDEMAQVMAAARRGETVEHQETQRLRRDGSRVDVSVTTSPLRASDGTIFGASEIAQDITERRRRERAERESARAQIRSLHEVEEFRSRFINSAAHELSNPLTPMAIQLRLLAQRAKDPATARAVAILGRNFQRVARGIHDLLDAARIESRRLVIARSPVSLAPLAREAVESFAPAALAVGVRLTAAGVPDVAVEGDEGRLMQVLYNLLSNAIKFTPPGGEVRVGAVADAERARLWVRDTGAGMEPGQIERLFLPYRQVHDPKKGPRGGMGLGLYISRALVHAHGGRMWAESEGPGEGTTMWVELPLFLPKERAGTP